MKSPRVGWGTFKKPVGPCIFSPRGGYPRDIEGPCYSTREAMWVHLVLFLSNGVRSFHRGSMLLGWMCPNFGSRVSKMVHRESHIFV